MQPSDHRDRQSTLSIQDLGNTGARTKEFVVIDAIAGVCHDCHMDFEILGDISQVETFATGSRIREVGRLRRMYGRGRWRKRKGIARIRLPNGSLRLAELHWYEASAIGRKEFKIKHLL